MNRVLYCENSLERKAHGIHLTEKVSQVDNFGKEIFPASFS